MDYYLSGIFLLLLCINCSCVGQEIVVGDNQQKLFYHLVSGTCTHALICSPHPTRFDVLKVSAKRGTHIVVIMQKSDLYEQSIPDKDRESVVGYFTDLHDKLALLWVAQGSMVGYFGSANFSDNHFNNTELVLYIPKAEMVPGLVQHVKNLFKKSHLYPGLKKSKHPVPLLSEGLSSSRKKRRGSCSKDELVSSFDFAEERGYDLVSWMADRIKVDTVHHYLISTMTLSHPVFVDRIRKAVLKGSSFEILVDRGNVKDAKKKYSVFYLARLSQCYPKGLAIRWKRGIKVDSEKSIHHAKLLVRFPNNKDENGLSIVSTANFTETGGEQYNCSLVLPHNSPNQRAIRTLKGKFYSWWSKAETVPSKPS